MIRPRRHRPEFLFPILVAGICLVTVAIALEAFSYFIIVGKGYNFYLPLDLQSLPEIASKSEMSRNFSAELGWELAAENSLGYRGEEKNIDEAVLAVFGDSFTQGHPWLEGSWPFLLEQRLNEPVLNFGVGAYGTDQALLRFRLRYLNRVSTPYVALCIQSENIARIVNVYRGFYMRGVGISSTKPRFELTETGSLRLLPNPVRNIEELTKLSDMNFLAELGKNDYWFNYFENFSLNQHAKFPYSLSVIRALPFYIGRLFNYRLGNDAFYKALYDDDEATEILRLLISEFIREAEASHAIPLIVFFPNSKDLIDFSNDGETVYGEFFRSVKSEHEYVFDGLKYFQPHLASGSSVSTFFKPRKDGHYNLLSEKLVSGGLYDDLCSVDKRLGLLANCES